MFLLLGECDLMNSVLTNSECLFLDVDAAAMAARLPVCTAPNKDTLF